MRYEFKNLQTGQPCCRGDNIKHLCNPCVQQAIAAHEAAGAARAQSAPTVAARRPAPAPLSPVTQAQVEEATRIMHANAAARVVPPIAPIEEAPAVPSLVAAINARRNGQTTYNLDAPVLGGGVKPYPVTVAAAHEEPPDPPSLTAAIRERRAR